MSKTLIIAEKPSVAADLARVLGKELGTFTRDKSGAYYENDQVIITSAVGHLLEQKKPTKEDGKSLPWKFEYLPVIPSQFQLEPIKQSEDRLKRVLRLAKRTDVTKIVNACDAGREGELIFDNMVRYGGWKKKILRLWMQSMTDDSILSAWHHMRTEAEMAPLRNAAICRSESDWLIGLNSTRALTILQSRSGFNITPAGRVQTPTLAILAQREQEIHEFSPEPYSEVVASFQVSAGSYEGKWIDPSWKKDENAPQKRPERIWDPALAEAICHRCSGKTGQICEEKKTASVVAPLLYDLTSLQREAANRYGFSAKRTLQLAQECYEKYKVLTYPRTDSRYLPEDYPNKVHSIIQSVADEQQGFSPFAKDILENNRIKPSNKRVFYSAKVSDHFAIIPTGKFDSLPPDARKLFDMVMARFLAVFFPPAIFEDTKRSTIIKHDNGVTDTFHTTGRVMVEAGWQAVYGRQPGNAGKDSLVPVQPGEQAQVERIDVRNAMTKPPARYTEATLLAAMEGAGKLVNDDELRAAMSERGLGTPATRASIIEGLISQEYIAREGRELIATRKGVELIDLLKRIGLETLTSPSMTGEWEYQLKQMEHAALDRPSFMEGIKALTHDIVARIKQFKNDMQQVELPELPWSCPACGSQGLKNTLDAVSCRSCSFSIRKTISGRDMSEDELHTLITNQKTDILSGFISRFGKPFEAGLELNAQGRSQFYFPAKPGDSESEEDDEFQSAGTITAKDGKSYEVLQNSKSWKLPQMTSGNHSSGMTISKVILGHPVSWDELNMLISTGKTALIKGFVSQRTKRPFDAYLVFQPKTGKVGFEFDKTERPTTQKTRSRVTTARAEDKDAIPESKTTSTAKASAKKSPATKRSTTTTRKKKTNQE